MPSVSKLTVSRCQFLEDTFEKLCQLFVVTSNISQVNLLNNKIDAEMLVQIIEKLSISKSTYQLDLEQNNIRSEGLILMIHFLKQNPNKILGIRVAHNNISDEGFNDLINALQEK